MVDKVRKEEKKKLGDCLSRIDEIIAKDQQWLERPKDQVAVTGETATSERQRKQDEIRNLKNARSKPYFGRVDFIENANPAKVQTYYIGDYHIPESVVHLSLEHPEPDVFSPWAPVSSLFYEPLSVSYISPDGKVDGQVTLKRIIKIENADLKDYKDEYKRRPSGEEVTIPLKETALARELSKSKEDRLRRIVTTIQPEQYVKIAAALQQVMMIQGAAGSGKSEVGLHRIAYLLSPHNQLNLNIAPNRVIFLGPTSQFLTYVSSLLPGLGVEKVRQTTVQDWLISTLSKKPGMEPGDKLFEKLLNDMKNKLDSEKTAARIKSSLKMARILDKYIQYTQEAIARSATNITVDRDVIVSRAHVRKIIRDKQKAPLNEQRKSVLSRILAEARNYLMQNMDTREKKVIEKQFESFWPNLDFKETYLNLVSNHESLKAVSTGILNEDEVNLLYQPSMGNRRFRKEDLASLCYLDHLLNERINIRGKRRPITLFDHVIVDEAQDVSPLEFLLLYRHSRNKSFTILGDIAQCLLPHRGITKWHDIRKVFARENIRRWDVPVSYRATRQITKYANMMLKKTDPRIPRPIPYIRQGDDPRFTRSKSFHEMVGAIANDIKRLQYEGMKRIAILCKSQKEALKLYKRLTTQGLKGLTFMDSKGISKTEVIVAPIYFTKGLEYDAVILANARQNNYPNTALHNKLLYIAVTRAAHKLSVHWYGTLAEILAIPRVVQARKKLESDSSNDPPK